MLIEIVFFTRRGAEVAHDLAHALRKDQDEVLLWTSAALAEDTGARSLPSLAGWCEVAFGRADALVFVAAAGIAVRSIAPYLKDKFTDPAVVVVDEMALHAIALLSGHVGGANELTRRIAGILTAEPVITTATDVRGRFSVDAWARSQHLTIAERTAAKAVSAALLDGQTVGLLSDFPLEGALPKGLTLIRDLEAATASQLSVGIHISARDDTAPFETTLHLIPPCVTVGLGCRRNVSPDDISAAVDGALRAGGISRSAVSHVATIDVKRDEEGLISWLEREHLSAEFLSAEELAAVAGTFSSSEFVRQTVGVGNVCERAATTRGETLVANKRIARGVTCALGAAEPTLCLSEEHKGSITLIGLGPGASKTLTQEAKEALDAAEVVYGYHAYLKLIERQIACKEVHASGMGFELDRCREALAAAEAGRRVALVSSGDAGIYGMASPLLELAQGKEVDIHVVAGVTAALSGAALVGAPLASDWCAISLSDYLTSWETIESRLAHAAEAGFAIALYNPKSKARPDHLARAVRILGGHLDPKTVCAVATDVGRQGETHEVTTLDRLSEASVSMHSIVFIGTRQTRMIDGRMVEPRGYRLGGDNG